MNVLVTGGAGYIGSVVCEELLQKGYKVVVFDSLENGHRKAVPENASFVHADLQDTKTLETSMKEHRIDAVVHMAAYALVGESVADPAKYYRNNLQVGLGLLNSMNEAAIDRIVFSSTSAIYGEPERQPIEETHLPAPTNPYGESKLAFERALHWYEKAHGICFVSLRYFNAAGATRTLGEVHDPETHLIPIVLEVATGKRAYLEVYGNDYPTRDSTCIRDYVHVVDLAEAHVLALERMGESSAIYNVGCGGDGYSVAEVIAVAEQVTGRQIPVRYGPRRPGDPASLVASCEKIKQQLGWTPKFQSLQEILSSTWDWMRAHPHGYDVASAR